MSIYYMFLKIWASCQRDRDSAHPLVQQPLGGAADGANGDDDDDHRRGAGPGSERRLLPAPLLATVPERDAATSANCVELELMEVGVPKVAAGASPAACSASAAEATLEGGAVLVEGSSAARSGRGAGRGAAAGGTRAAAPEAITERGGGAPKFPRYRYVPLLEELSAISTLARVACTRLALPLDGARSNALYDLDLDATKAAAKALRVKLSALIAFSALQAVFAATEPAPPADGATPTPPRRSVIDKLAVAVMMAVERDVAAGDANRSVTACLVTVRRSDNLAAFTANLTRAYVTQANMIFACSSRLDVMPPALLDRAFDVLLSMIPPLDTPAGGTLAIGTLSITTARLKIFSVSSPSEARVWLTVQSATSAVDAAAVAAAARRGGTGSFSRRGGGGDGASRVASLPASRALGALINLFDSLPPPLPHVTAEEEQPP